MMEYIREHPDDLDQIITENVASPVTINYQIRRGPLGLMLFAATPQTLCYISLPQTIEYGLCELKKLFPASTMVASEKPLPMIDSVLEWMEHPATQLAVPAILVGTAFQIRVWRALADIPLATTISYGQLAHRIGQANAVRAVGGACAANRLAIVVPCHRVIGSDGSLGGYRWGIERKRWLLNHEQGCTDSSGSFSDIEN